MTDVAALLGVLTPEDIAPVLGCTPAHVEELFRTRQLPGIKHGRGWRTQVDAMRQALRDQALQAMTPAPGEPAPDDTPKRTSRRKPLAKL